MKTKLKLYRVTLAWDANDSEQVVESVWAKDRGAAIKETATRMADTVDNLERRDRKGLIETLIANAGPHAVEDVACSIKNDIHDLLAGPPEDLTKEAEHAKRIIFDLLALFGGSGCE